MTDLEFTLDLIAREKDLKILPENIKKGVTIFSIPGSLEGGTDSSDATATASDILAGKTAYVNNEKITGTLDLSVKLFESEEQMNQDISNVGDLALVYNKETELLNENSVFRCITFPSVVTLSSAISVSSLYAFSSDNISYSVLLSPTSFIMESLNSDIKIEYTSEDGITYNRIDNFGESVDFREELTLQSDEWNNVLLNFMQIDKYTFNGLYKSTLQKHDNIFYLLEMSGVNLDINYDTYNAWYIQGASFDYSKQVDEINLDEYNEMFKSFLYSKGYTSTNIWLFKDNSDNLCFAQDYYSSNQLSDLLINNVNRAFGGMKALGSSGAYGGKISVYIIDRESKTYSLKANYNSSTSAWLGDYYFMQSDLQCKTLPIVVNINVDERINFVSSMHLAFYDVLTSDIYAPFDTYKRYNKYLSAPSQLTLNDSNDLKEGQVAYGKEDIITGTASIGDSQLNLFCQEEEPEIKDGIWVQTTTEYENKLTVQNILTTNGEYSYLSNIPFKMGDGTIVSIGTDIYVITGTKNYKYDTLTDTYTKMTDVPYSFSDNKASAVGTDVYLIGGGTGNVFNYKYDTLTDTYTRMADTPVTLNLVGTISYGTDIYIFGSQFTNYTKYACRYDTLTNTYTRLANLPYDCARLNPAIINKTIYLFGLNSGKYLYTYDIDSNTYTYVSNAIPYNATGCHTTSIGTDIYLFSGTNSSSVNYAYRYDTLTNTFTKLVNIPFSFRYGSTVTVGLDIYLIGGDGMYADSPLNLTCKFTLTLMNLLNNSLIIEQGGLLYSTKLISTNIDGLEYKFTNVWLKEANGTLNTTTPIYLGDGTQWNQIN